MWRIAVAFTLSICLGACNQIFGIPEAGQGGRIGGNVHGLWDGTDGVALRLRAEGIDTLFTVSSNGEFFFDPLLRPGMSYIVSVEADPVRHNCIVRVGGNGTSSEKDATNLAVACTGPIVSIALSDGWAQAFDPTQEAQTFSASIAAQDVSLTISSNEVANAAVDGETVVLGQVLAAKPLPLGRSSTIVAFVADGGLSKSYELIFDRGGDLLQQAIYGKASNTAASDDFGIAISLSGDTLAVGSCFEDSAATGVNGSQVSNGAEDSGAVYIFLRRNDSWSQQAYVKASNTGSIDHFGCSLSLSGDTLAVGALDESSVATGVNGNQADNSASYAGAVYVFVRNGTTWSQQAYVKASNTGTFDNFGSSLSLAGDTLVVGAPRESSAARGVNGNQTDNSASDAGAVYVFVRLGTTWSQQAYIKASNTEAFDSFGTSISLFGNTLAVGATYERSGAKGVNGNQADNSEPASGAVYVFTRSGSTWTQQAYLKASNSQNSDFFGETVALYANTLAVGAYLEDSGAKGVNGDQDDNSAQDAGSVYVFTRSGTSWSQEAYLKSSNSDARDHFGTSISLEGDLLAVAASGEDSAARGINRDQADNSAYDTGAVYLFARNGGAWSQQMYLKVSNADPNDGLGYHAGTISSTKVFLNGHMLVVSAPAEASAATGINGDQSDNTATAAGAFYLFR